MSNGRRSFDKLDSSVPCREEQLVSIQNFIDKRLIDNNGGCMYICGMPGTGKTATVEKAVELLQRKYSKRKTAKFNLACLNCMKISNSRQSYVEICKQLFGKKFSIEGSISELNEKFTQPDKKKTFVLLIIDELDALCKKKQDVIYNLFNWSTFTDSKLIIITIANTMDLPERLLDKKIYSRLGLTRLVFQPYNFNQICTILKKKVFNNTNCKINNDAIELISRKVASVSGDLRRAMEISSLILESNEKITIESVVQIMKQMLVTPQIKAIECCSRLEQLFLEAVLNQSEKHVEHSPQLKDLFPEFCSICTMNGIETPSKSIFLGISSKLEAMRLILNVSSTNDILKNVMLNVSSDELKTGLKIVLKLYQ